MAELTIRDKNKILKLIQRKLAGIPSDHLPLLTLSDFINQTPKALALPNIPPDLQLPFFLTHRKLIDESNGFAIKDDAEQHLDITRAIFFYRLDEAHQFQRYHDSHRWNVALFLALLTVPKTSSDKYARDAVFFAPAARHWVISYLDAVLEHHNDPTVFGAREKFIRLWKDSRYEFFVFTAGQKKLLKILMKKFSAKWNEELERVKIRLGQRAYDKWIAKFVGVLIPGRWDHRAQIKPQISKSNAPEWPAGTLLTALESPLGASAAVKQSDLNKDAAPLANHRQVLQVLKTCDVRVVLHHLMQIFPPKGDVQEYWADEVVLAGCIRRPEKVSVHDHEPSSSPPQMGYAPLDYTDTDL